MNEYTVQVTAESSASFESAELAGYLFSSLDEPTGMLTITKSLKADDWHAALASFNGGLSPLLDAVSFMLRSATSAYGTSTTIRRDDINKALVILTKKHPGGGLFLSGSDKKSEIRAIIERIADENDIAFRYLRQAGLSTGAAAQTAQLLQCVESLAGDIPQSSSCLACGKKLVCARCGEPHRPPMTDQTKRREILGDLNDFYFVKAHGEDRSIRNKLAHGFPVDEQLLSGRIGDLYDKVISELGKKYDINPIVSGIKGINGLVGYAGYTVFIEYDEPLPNAFELINLLDARSITSDSRPYRSIGNKEAESLWNSF